MLCQTFANEISNLVTTLKPDDLLGALQVDRASDQLAVRFSPDAYEVRAIGQTDLSAIRHNNCAAKDSIFLATLDV